MKKIFPILSVFFLAFMLPGMSLLANTAPQFPADSTSSQLLQDTAWDTTLTLDDPDVAGGDSVEFTLENNPGLSTGNFTTNSIDLSWTPTNDDVGTYWVRVIAADSAGAEDTLTMGITVANRNDAPSLDSVSGADISHTETFNVTANATDPDSPYGETLTYSLSDEPSGMTIGSASGGISYDPPEITGDSSYTVTVTVTDDSGATDSQSFTLNVDNLPEPPTNINPVESNGTVTISFTGSIANDVDYYRLYYGTSESNMSSEDTKPGSPFTVNQPPYGVVAYYAVTTVDVSGFESSRSSLTDSIDLTEISGTWTADEIVQGDVTIPAGNTLTIENGAAVDFDNTSGMIVHGKLLVNPAGTDTVRFEAVSGNWSGIRFVNANADTSDIRYASVSGAWLNTSASNQDGWGAGIYAENSVLKVLNSSIKNNTSANGSGGGIALISSSYSKIKNTLLVGNSATQGAAVYSSNSELDLVNNTIYNNSGGSAVKIQDGTPSVRNNIIVSNGDGLGVETNITTGFSYNLFYNNNGSLTTPSEQMSNRPSGFGVVDSVHKFTEVGIDSYGHIFTDPMFVSPNNSNFRLQAASPAVNMGNPAGSVGNEPEPNGDRLNLGAFGGTAQARETQARFPTDFNTSATEDSTYRAYLEIPRDQDFSYFFDFANNSEPGWLSLNDNTPESEYLTGTPDNAASEQTFDVDIEVRATGPLTHKDTISVSIDVTNQPPVVSALPDSMFAREDSLFETTFSSSDAGQGAGVTWTVWINSADSSHLVDNAGNFQWTPRQNSVGNHELVVEADDGKSANSTDRDTTVINVSNTNDAPVLSAVDDTETPYTDSPFTLSTDVQDSDIPYGDSLRYSLVNAPSGMSISEAGQIHWGLPQDMIGDSTYTITVVVTDDSSASDSATFSLSLDNPPEPATNLAVTESNGVLGVTFNASVATDIAQYSLYHGKSTSAWDSTSLGTATSYQDSTPPYGTEQLFAVTVFDDNGFSTNSPDTISVDLTEVSGTWTRDFTIEDNITVLAGQTLEIDGVTVTFASKKGLTVRGVLKVNPSGTDTTIFTTSGADWKGIRFYDTNSDTSVIRYAKVINTKLTASDTSGWGAGVFAENSLLSITHSFFRSNTSQNGAGGALALLNSDVLIRNSIFYKNNSSYGSAIYAENTQLDLINNTIINNPLGPAIKISGGVPSVRNNIIAHNLDGYGIETNITTSFTYNLFYNNNGRTAASAQMLTRPANFGVADSIHKFSGAEIDQYGNLFTNPAFINDTTDFHLKNTSPAINVGDPDDAGWIDNEPEPNGDVVNLGAYGGTGEATKAKIRFPYNFSSSTTEDSLYSESIDIPRDGDITYFFETVDGEFPSWLTLDDTPGQEHLTGTPTNNHSETDSTVSISIRQSSVVNPVRDTVSFELYVANSPPVILGLADTVSAVEDSQTIVEPTASDSSVTWAGWLDGTAIPADGDTITINVTTGRFTWTPGSNDVGLHTLLFQADDNMSSDSIAADTVTIDVSNTNDPPHFVEGQTLRNANAWQMYSDTLHATDPDSAYGDVLSFALMQAPARMSVEASTGLLAWQPYYSDFGQDTIQAVVSDAGGLQDTVTAYIAVDDTAAPAPPQHLAGTASDTTISLSWDASLSHDVASYTLFRKLKGTSSFSEVSTFGLDTLEYVDTGLINDTTYYYVAVAVDSADNSSAGSDTLAIQPVDVIAPDPPTNFAAFDSNGVVYMFWDASPTTDVENYEILRSLNQTAYAAIDTVDVSVTETTWTLDSLATMWLTVQALDESWNPSDTANVVRISPLAPPANVQLISKAWQLQLTWDPITSTDATAIRIYRRVGSGGSYTLHAEVNPAKTEFVDDVNGQDTYYYMLSAYNADGPSESTKSSPVSGTAKTKGSIAGNWSPANAPYKPTGSIVVDSGDSLTIQAGTDVLFQGYYDFIVYGTLRVLGNTDSLVALTYDDTAPTSGYPNWKGITYSSAASGNLLQGAHITLAKSTGSIAGGAVRIVDSSPTLRECQIDSNHSYSNGGAIAISGNSAPDIVGNLLRGNVSSNGYGGAFAILGGAATIRNNLISNNSATDAAAVYVAAGQSMSFHNNNVFSNGFEGGTTQPFNVGGVWDTDGQSDISSNIFTGNSGYPVGAEAFSGTFHITHNIIVSNTINAIRNGPAAALANSVENTNFDSTDVYGNMVADPLFIGDTDSLDRNSPALDAGKPVADYANEPEPNGDQVNMGRFGNTDIATTSPIRLRETIPANQQPVEDSPYEYVVSGRHDAGAVVTYEAVFDQGAEWLSFSQVDNSLSGDPTNDHVGATYSVTIYAEDDTYNRADTANYTLQVIGRPPQISGVTDTAIVQGELLTLVYSSDDDPFATYTARDSTLTENLPAFSNDTLRWRPSNTQTGNHAIQIWAKDNHDDSTYVTLNVAVSNVNDPPVFLPGDSLSLDIYEKAVWNYRLDSVAVDADTIWGDSLRYQLLDAPASVTFNDTTGTMSWLPTNADIGTFDFSAVASDNAGLADTLFFNITVINVIDPPKIHASLDTTLYEDHPMTFPLTAWAGRVTDPDPTDSLESLNWTFTSQRNLVQVERITGLTEDSLRISQLVADTSGIDTLLVGIADNDTTVDTTMIVTVIPLNDPPALAQAVPDTTVLEDTPRVILLEKIQDYFTDADQIDSLRFSANALNTGLDSLRIEGSPRAPIQRTNTIRRSYSRRDTGGDMPNLAPAAAMGDSVALVAYPTLDFFGEIYITVTATDDSSAFVSDTLLLTVTSVNDTPSLTFPDLFTISEDDSLTIDLDLYVQDIDHDTSEMSWTLPVYFGQDTAAVSAQILPPADVRALATRNTAREQQPTEQRRKPAAELHLEKIAPAGKLTALQPAADILTFHLDSVTHALTIVPDSDVTVERAMYRVRVEDPDGLWATDTLLISVRPVNDPPRFVMAFPDTTFSEHDTLRYTLPFLQSTVRDVDTPADSLHFTFQVGDSLILTSSDSLYTIKAQRFWFGQDSVFLQVSDGLAADSTAFQVNVVNGNDAPVWTEAFPDTTIFRPSQTREFTLRDSALVYDPDPATPISALQFEVEFGSVVRINYNSSTTRARLFVLEDTTAVDTVYFTAIDPQGARGRHQMTVIIDSTYVGVGEENLLPAAFFVKQNYPNPFNPSTTIEYGLPEAADVSLRIFNLRGQTVYTKHLQGQAPGYHTFIWNGRNRQGSLVSSGMYIYFLRATSEQNTFQKIRKMVLIR